MAQRVEISGEAFAALLPELTAGPKGDGRDGQGRMFSIVRYHSRTTGRLYDRVFTVGEGGGERIFDVTPDDPKPG